MKKKIAYIITTAVIALAAFYIGRNTTATQYHETKTENANNIEEMENALSQIEYWETTDDGIDFYTFDGNVYEWR